MRANRIVIGASLLLALAVAAIASVAAAQLPAQPSVGTFNSTDLARAHERALTPTGPPQEWELPAGGDEAAPPAGGGYRANDDNDTAHYCRGRNLIIHVFISHSGGTWTADGMNTAGANAAVAKQYYLDHGPVGADLTYDYQGTNYYYYYLVTLPYNIPDSGMSETVVNDALTALGFSDADGDGHIVDDFTFMLQNWNGGWDNVLACFEPKQTGRGWASYGFAMTFLYTNDNGNVFAHEWGHLYGACDEYVEGGHCNGGIDCGPCQSWYLHDVFNNGNCQMASCPSHVSCLMIDNTFDNLCDYTPNHWAWVDSANRGLLDDCKRRVSGDTFCTIYELYHNGWFFWNGTSDGMSISQRWNNWAAVGLRSPSGADYDLSMYGDNNHNNLYASSAYGSGMVDFVVGDYNHSPIGVEHLAVSHYAGNTNAYSLGWEGGSEMLYPDGVLRSGDWSSYNVVRVWDVPLFAGETVTFVATPTTGTLDLGMSLFRSNGNPYWAGRAAAEWTADASGPGGAESHSYVVPADDVYGLVLFANSAVDGSFTIQIGPTPYTLADGSPFYSAYPLRLFNYDPDANYWAFVGTRPDAATGVRLGLFDDPSYQNLLATSNAYGDAEIEFFAVDYNHAPLSRDYLRVVRDDGSGNHRTEFEHHADRIQGAISDSWVSPHVGKGWDAYLTGGQPYFLREYHDFSSPLDTGIYIFSSNDGNDYKDRHSYAAASNFRPPSDGGEWFSYTPPANDWYGIYQILNNEASDSYSLWLGAQISMDPAVAQQRTEEVVWGSGNVTSIYWTVFAARPTPGDQASTWLYGDPAYTITSLAASDQTNSPVTLVVGDYNHDPTGTVYPRYRRGNGSNPVDVEWEGGSQTLGFTPGGINTYNLAWRPGDVALAWDVLINGGIAHGQDVTFEVKDLSGALDFGIAFFASNNGTYYTNLAGAVARSDAQGVGGTERITVHTTVNDWYGFVIYNKNESGGNYRIRVIDPVASGVETVAASPGFDLRVTSANPFHDAATLEFSLVRDGAAEVVIYDVSGRQVRSLARDRWTAGSHTAVWDGRDDAGAPVPSGIYFARLRSDRDEVRVKLIRS